MSPVDPDDGPVPEQDDRQPGAAPLGGYLRVQVDGDPTPVPVAVEGREGDSLLVRRLEPNEDPPWVAHDPSVREVILVTPVRYVGINRTAEVGRTDDLITAMRVIEVRREGSVVYGRTLSPTEPDPGTAVLLKPGDSFCLEPGMMTVSIAAIDAAESKGVEGYVPVTGVLWSWMSTAPPAYEHGYRYLLATARRLDAARTLLDQVRDLLDQEPPSVGPALRSHLWRTVSTVEVTVVAFGRALDMSVQMKHLIGVASAPDPEMLSLNRRITPLRNAYEHIEDRALGRVNRKPDPEAVTVFDWTALFERQAMQYGGQEISLSELMTATDTLRAFVLQAAGDLSEGVEPLP